MTFKCKENCGICCGPVGFKKEDSIKNKKHEQVKPTRILGNNNEVWFLTEDIFCIYLNRETKECNIYEDRPDICKSYGIDPRMPCLFFNPDGSRKNRYEKELARIRLEKTLAKAMSIVQNNNI